MGGAWSCCLPCAAGGAGAGGAGVGGTAGSRSSISRPVLAPDREFSSVLQPEPLAHAPSAPLGDLDEDIDNFEELVGPIPKEEETLREGSTQHRLSPRLQDIEEEDDEDCRNSRGK